VSIDTLQTLSIKENLINNGTVGGQGYLVLDGASAQEISGTGSFTYLRLDNTNGTTLNDDADIIGVLDLQDGLFIIAPDKFFTFKSSETKTAVIAEVAVTAGISGCVIVERYMPPTNRSYRYMASPVSTTNCGRQTI
ncbi:hypothetical protein G3567_13275, partial [Psychroflexus sp. YR1-1]|nr:hypothetical protein [Psychroflexus aurantiacus]